MAMVTDDFNRADSVTLGANWTATTWNITTNEASMGAPTSHDVYTGAAWTGGADHYAEANVLTSFAAALDYVGVVARSSTPGGTVTAYLTSLVDDGSQSIELSKIVADVKTVLGSVVGGASNDLLRCQASGTTVRSFGNGVQKSSVTDAAIASGKPGLYGTVATTTFTVDNFAADVVTATVNPSMFRWGHRPGPFAPGSGR